MQLVSSRERTLGLFRLIMIAVISVDSIRNIPISAQYGMALVSFYVIAGLAFFLPLILVTSRFASEYPNTGGSYLWIEAAFGKRIGFLSIWLQWVYQIIWYPTIFAFIATTIAALVHPAWEVDQWFILVVSLFSFWLMTCLSFFGIRVTSWVSSIGAIVGTLLPMLVIIVLAIFWLAKGLPSATPLVLKDLIPSHADMANLGFFANILFSILGLEVAAMHAGDVKAPEKTYRRAMSIAGFLILVSLILSSLAMCVVIAPAKIGLLNGLMDAFQVFFNAYGLGWMLPVMGIAILLGSLGIACSWIVGLARGLHVACVDVQVFSSLQLLNAHHMPMRILVLQGLIYSALVSVFLVFPNVNNSYWMLSALTSQFALVYYVLLFMAAIKLRRVCVVGLRKLAQILFPMLAIVTSVVGICVGFLPPSSLPVSGVLKYELLLLAGFVVFCLPLIFIFKQMKICD